MIKVVSRSSPLARVQTAEFLESLASLSPESAEPSFELVYLESFGDKHKELSLWDPQAPDFFTRELDEALRSGHADLAVHSAKDLPVPLPLDLEIYALGPCLDNRDALYLREGGSLANCKPGSRIATSSPSRRDQLLALRPDLVVVPVRGTIEERLDFVQRGEAEGLIVAHCALLRLGLAAYATELLNIATHPLQGHLVAVGKKGKHRLAALCRPLDIRRGWGTVSLVGAGPGDPGLLTLRAKLALEAAEVIFHDALANEEILSWSTAQRVFVGKRRGKHEMNQQAINQRLYEAALSGARVVRLKGGDPLLFGRGREELDFLRERLVSVELIPGISAAFGAAAFSEIPLTERNVSRSVSFCTAWPVEQLQVPLSDTRVYFMGAKSFEQLVAKHYEAGFKPELPVALVYNASLPDQKVWYTTLGKLCSEYPDPPTPLLVITGPVVRVDRARAWWAGRPLLWYTGTDPSRVAERFRVVHQPLIRVEPAVEPRALLSWLAGIPKGDWLAFTSPNAVEQSFALLKAGGKDTRVFASCQLAVIGKATARRLEAYGLRADLVADLEHSLGLVSSLAPSLKPGARVWIPSSDKALPRIAEGLATHGVSVERFVLYRTLSVSPFDPEALPALSDLDAVYFSSPSCVSSFLRWLGNDVVLKQGLLLYAIGPETEASLLQAFPDRREDIIRDDLP